MPKLFKDKVQPRITINPQGRLHLSKMLLDKYGQPDFAELKIEGKTLIINFAPKMSATNKTIRKVCYPDVATSSGQGFVSYTILAKTIFKVKKGTQLKIKLSKHKVVCSL